MSCAVDISARISAPRRRNGRQQACEPCRKRKVACDHRLPVCSRCRRGNITSSCVYVLDQTRTAKTTPPPAEAPSPQSSEASKHHCLQAVEMSPQTDNNVGYLGATSFSAVFQENQSTLLQSDRTPEAMEGFSGSNLDKQTMDTALTVLQLIPDRATCKSLFTNNDSPSDPWCRLAAQILNESIWITFGDVLEGKRTMIDMTRMAKTLCQNSSVPLREDYVDPIEWLRSFSGANLRWESLGILFAYWALGTKFVTVSTRETDSLRGDRRKLRLKFKLGVSKCLDMCRNGASANTLLAFMLYNYTIIESITTGDASLQHWKLHGELAALVTFLGLHVTPPSMINDHSISSEMKRRVFLMISKSDKCVATFTGRPPLLQSKFASTPLPLDISDEELLNPDCLPLARSRNVDENGWNTKGAIYSTTIQRVRMANALVKEEILEIALQPNQTERTSLTLLNGLKARQIALQERVPEVLKFRESDITDPDVNGRTLCARLFVRIDNLQNMFFIHRLLNKGETSLPAEMVEVCLELITLALVFWTHQDKLLGMQDDFEWLALCYAAPAAGILCAELLRGGPKPIAATDITSSAKTTVVTRSAIIQQLSLLVGFFEWVGPVAPNIDSSRSVKMAIRHVLDQALNGTNGASHTAAAPANWVGDWGMELSADINDCFNFELLDTFDWLRPDATN